jgi:ribosomal protein S18 acetylase RimI-like enzyme
MAIVIREATEGDYEALCTVIDQVDQLHRDNLPQRFNVASGPVRTRQFILNAVNAPDIGLFVADVERTLAGFIQVIVRDVPDTPILVPRRYAVVDNLAVTEEYRRSGIGRALMETAEAWAKAKGATSIELNVYAFNQTAERFYRELGYEILSHRMTKSL